MRESASPTGVCTGRILATPISSSGVKFGACVLLARKQATCGKPMPTTTVSRSFSSRAPAAAMISVARMSVISIPAHRIGLQPIEMGRAASLGEIRGVIRRLENVRADVVADSVAVPGMLDIQLQMFGIVIIAAEHGGGMGAEWLNDHRFDPMRGNDRALGLLLDLRRQHDLFGDHDEAAAGLRLFLILPAR